MNREKTEVEDVVETEEIELRNGLARTGGKTGQRERRS